jgi:hypothetical protein
MSRVFITSAALASLLNPTCCANSLDRGPAAAGAYPSTLLLLLRLGWESQNNAVGSWEVVWVKKAAMLGSVTPIPTNMGLLLLLVVRAADRDSLAAGLVFNSSWVKTCTCKQHTNIRWGAGK